MRNKSELKNPKHGGRIGDIEMETKITDKE